MDSDGNIFYTRAGNLQLDNNSGNLVDANGYTVLGVTGDPLGKAAGADKIHLSIPGKNNAQSANSPDHQRNRVYHNIPEHYFRGQCHHFIPAGRHTSRRADIVVKSGELKDSSITVSVNKNAILQVYLILTAK